MEVYNEEVMDLLSGQTNLKLQENTNGMIFIPGLKEEIASSEEEIFSLLRLGEDDGEGVVVVSQLNIVDLAGSERASQAATTGNRLKEGCSINRSLLTLSRVIRTPFVNYRDSKLTRILQNSLGGNSKTAIICTVTPASIDETESTLRFATRAKDIKNRPVRNEDLTDEALLRRYKKKISEMQSQINKLVESSSLQELQQEKDLLAEQLREKEEKIMDMKRLICISSRLTASPLAKDLSKELRNRRETWCPGIRSPPSVLFSSRLTISRCGMKRKMPLAVCTENSEEEPDGSQEEVDPKINAVNDLDEEEPDRSTATTSGGSEDPRSVTSDDVVSLRSAKVATHLLENWDYQRIFKMPVSYPAGLGKLINDLEREKAEKQALITECADANATCEKLFLEQAVLQTRLTKLLAVEATNDQLSQEVRQLLMQQSNGQKLCSDWLVQLDTSWKDREEGLLAKLLDVSDRITRFEQIVNKLKVNLSQRMAESREIGAVNLYNLSLMLNISDDLHSKAADSPKVCSDAAQQTDENFTTKQTLHVTADVSLQTEAELSSPPVFHEVRRCHRQ
ncbi:unnamed protein product [Soboliphyme baturini]|uniref:Kinesin-like protein n=1 Tax=Soboliphyme baturini TaxID=241478 RepID=A0A183J2D6_9BILA|nr:unnamed protein product [Soboliphyme baturini]